MMPVRDLLRATRIGDDYVRPIGLMAIYFNRLDQLLSSAIAIILDIGLSETAVFTTEINRFATRLRIFRAAVKRRVEDPTLLSEFSDLIHRLERANTLRNKVLHANWVSITHNGGGIIQLRKHPFEAEELTPTDVQDMADETEETLAVLFAVSTRYLYHKWGKPLPSLEI